MQGSRAREDRMSEHGITVSREARRMAVKLTQGDVMMIVTRGSKAVCWRSASKLLFFHHDEHQTHHVPSHHFMVPIKRAARRHVCAKLHGSMQLDKLYRTIH